MSRDGEPAEDDAVGERGQSRLERELAAELLRIHQESYGRGAESSSVHILGDIVLCLLDGLQLLPNEQFLVDSGHGDGVVEVRSQFQQAIQPTFSAAVERATGRRVISFVSATKLSPHWSAEIFRLGEPPTDADDDRP